MRYGNGIAADLLGSSADFTFSFVRAAHIVGSAMAEITVRVKTNGVSKVSVLPARWDTGRKGAPPADIARPVKGETNLFSSQLWFSITNSAPLPPKQGRLPSRLASLPIVRRCSRVPLPNSRSAASPRAVGSVNSFNSKPTA